MSEKMQEFEVNGFLFRDESMAEQARREVEGIKYIQERNNLDNPQMVLKVYNKMIEQQIFETPVGVVYLKELQTYLKGRPDIQRKEILPIPIEEKEGKEDGEEAQKSETEKGKAGRLSISLVANIILALTVIAMFVITLTSKHPTILNYEEQILNKYSGWEQELKEREQQIKVKEQELGILP